MANIKNIRECLIQSFSDAGCSEKLCERCLELAESGNTKQLTLLLNEKRKKALEKIHNDQKQLDCIDYLIYKISKENEL